MSQELCKHGVNDDCTLTEKAVNTDYQYGTRSVISTYWCPVHRSFLILTNREHFKPTVTWESLGV